MAGILKIQIEPRISAFPEIVKQVEMFCTENEVPMALSFKINLVIEEVVTNSITHANYGGRTPDINLTVEWENDQFEVTIEDNAEPFDPLTEVPLPNLKTGVSERPVGGLGVHLVRSMVDETNYERAGDRNKIQLVGKL